MVFRWTEVIGQMVPGSISESYNSMKSNYGGADEKYSALLIRPTRQSGSGKHLFV